MDPKIKYESIVSRYVQNSKRRIFGTAVGTPDTQSSKSTVQYFKAFFCLDPQYSLYEQSELNHRQKRR